MNFAYNLLGGAGAPFSKKFKISATFAVPGVYATAALAGGTGIVKGIATTATDQVGVTTDTGTYTTTQSATMVEGTVSLITNPGAVYRIHAVSTATSAALLTTTASAAASNGLSVTITTGDPVPNSPSMDEGQIFCISGANGGTSRKVTSVSATVATVIVPFANAVAVGDVFLVLPWMPGDNAANNVNFTTNILDARGDIAVGTGADLRPVEVEIDGSSITAAQNNSYVYAYLVAHQGWLAT